MSSKPLIQNKSESEVIFLREFLSAKIPNNKQAAADPPIWIASTIPISMASNGPGPKKKSEITIKFGISKLRENSLKKKLRSMNQMVKSRRGILQPSEPIE